MYPLIIGSFFALFIWEFICYKTKYQYKPSTAFNYIANLARSFFKSCGIIIAFISSFYTYLGDLWEYLYHDLAQVCEDFFFPIWKILSSWTWVFVGYFEKLNLNKYPWLVFLGSVSILGLMGFITYRYGWFPIIGQWIETNVHPVVFIILFVFAIICLLFVLSIYFPEEPKEKRKRRSNVPEQSYYTGQTVQVTLPGIAFSMKK
jgi:hypothetical protein